MKVLVLMAVASAQMRSRLWIICTNTKKDILHEICTNKMTAPLNAMHSQGDQLVEDICWEIFASLIFWSHTDGYQDFSLLWCPFKLASEVILFHGGECDPPWSHRHWKCFGENKITDI